MLLKIERKLDFSCIYSQRTTLFAEGQANLNFLTYGLVYKCVYSFFFNFVPCCDPAGTQLFATYENVSMSN